MIFKEEVAEPKIKHIMFYYGIFSSNNNIYDFRLVKQKLEFNRKAYDISDIYGLDSTLFNKEWNVFKLL